MFVFRFGREKIIMLSYTGKNMRSLQTQREIKLIPKYFKWQIKDKLPLHKFKRKLIRIKRALSSN